MEFSQGFENIASADLRKEAERRKAEGWRYVQILAVNGDNNVKLVYSFMKDGKLENLCLIDVEHDGAVQSITDLYLEAFVCENEIHDLFGISFPGLAIDFNGHFYKVSADKPMTIISPAQLAEREKAAKIAAAKAAKEAKAKQAAEGDDSESQSANDDMEAKLKAMDPEKAAKVRAAMEAKAKKEEQAALEAKLAGMDPEKAAKVRAAMEAKAKRAGKEAE